MRLIAPFAIAVFALFPIACASETDDGAPPVVADGSEEELKAAKAITESDDGKTIDVADGQQFAIKLASNPTTGFKWVVAVVDRTLGQPASEKFSPSGPGVGSGGTQTFVWKTESPLDMTGKHTIELRLVRGTEHAAPAKTFKVTVDISGAAKCGDHPACGSTQKCSFCFGHLACIPKGALC